MSRPIIHPLLSRSIDPRIGWNRTTPPSVGRGRWGVGVRTILNHRGYQLWEFRTATAQRKLRKQKREHR